MEILNDEDQEYSEKHTAKIFFEDFLDLVKVYTDTTFPPKNSFEEVGATVNMLVDVINILGEVRETDDPNVILLDITSFSDLYTRSIEPENMINEAAAKLMS